MLPAQNSGFCRNCDPFEHGACKCHCHQCMEAQHLAGTVNGADFSDIIESHKCACITADGVQCSLEPMPGKEWCYDCSAGYCDCSCKQCVTGEHQHRSGGTPDGDSAEVEQTEHVAAKPLTPLKMRAAGLQEANQRDKEGRSEKVLHKNAAWWADLSTTKFSQVLGVTQWDDEAPLADLQQPSKAGNKRLTVKQRVANRNASLAEYTATRAANDYDSNGDERWASRVGRKHRLATSNSTSPKLRRSKRSLKRTARFLPGVSNSPVDDSDSYSDAEMQEALQQRGIPSLIEKHASRSIKQPNRGRKSPRAKPIPRSQLSASQRLPESRDVAKLAAKRTKQSSLLDYPRYNVTSLRRKQLEERDRLRQKEEEAAQKNWRQLERSEHLQRKQSQTLGRNTEKVLKRSKPVRTAASKSRSPSNPKDAKRGRQ